MPTLMQVFIDNKIADAKNIPVSSSGVGESRWTTQRRDPSTGSGQAMGHPVWWRFSDTGHPPERIGWSCRTGPLRAERSLRDLCKLRKVRALLGNEFCGDQWEHRAKRYTRHEVIAARAGRF
jgi:hypothetical protein